MAPEKSYLTPETILFSEFVVKPFAVKEVISLGSITYR